jgi:hypothetical protein
MEQLRAEIVGSRWSFGSFKLRPNQSLLIFWSNLRVEFFNRIDPKPAVVSGSYREVRISNSSLPFCKATANCGKLIPIHIAHVGRVEI